MTEPGSRLRYAGEGGSLFLLLLGNAALSVLTLGIYSFWARSKVREFHYSHTEFLADRFAWHGTGGELLRGWLKALGVMLLLIAALSIVYIAVSIETADVWTQFAVNTAFYAVFGALVVYAVNGARRYRFARSSFRGIRFSYDGDFESFGLLMLKGILLSIVTLGLYTPAFQNARQEYLVRHTRFGTERFEYDGEAEPLVLEFLKHLVLTLPTFGLNWSWYRAFRHRHYWSHTRVSGARFNSEVTGFDVLVLNLTNIALAGMTFGLAFPWVITRTHEFWFSRIELLGAVDWAAVRQRADAADATAEGMAHGLDVDVGIEL